MVRSLARWVIKIVSARIDRELIEQLRIEPGLLTDFRVGFVKDRQGTFDELVVSSGGDSNILHVERDRADTLMPVGLHLPLGFEHGNGPIAEVIVEHFQRAIHDSFGLFPRAALRKNGLDRMSEK